MSNLRQEAKFRFRNLHARLKQGIPTFAYLPVTILPLRFYALRVRFALAFHHLFLDI